MGGSREKMMTPHFVTLASPTFPAEKAINVGLEVKGGKKVENG